MLGEYVAPENSTVPQAILVKALGALGHSPAAVRQAISRSAREGALTTTRRGGGAVVELREQARVMLLRGAKALDTPADDTDWDGLWSVFVVRTQGQDQRSRYRLRTSMLLEGLGYLGNGVWLAPHRRFHDEILSALSAEPGTEVTVLSSRIEHPEVLDVVERAWDLDAIAQRYDRFIDEFDQRAPTTDQEFFAAWTELVHAWRECVITEPGLPAEVLRPDWPRDRGRELVVARRATWRAPAHAFFTTLAENTAQ
ncbi:hypothetical protein NRB20_53700 [Nocardia sp. RB20]|uniref:PaaX family transcriptional regulator n=1 Tax=Nocardia macrotermitis TaxID=2585198 RepID=A0A7K0D954_9NOCA|nr:hypothetical protein [Nocardia macrotermitis]